MLELLGVVVVVLELLGVVLELPDIVLELPEELVLGLLELVVVLLVCADTKAAPARSATVAAIRLRRPREMED